jgi:hypothetical protein
LTEQTSRAQEALVERQTALEEEWHTSYFQRIALAQREWRVNNAARAEALLAECEPKLGLPDHRSWEWQFLRRLGQGKLLRFEAATERVQTMVFHPYNGKILATTTQSGPIRLWDAQTGKLNRELKVEAPISGTLAIDKAQTCEFPDRLHHESSSPLGFDRTADEEN